MSSPYPPAPPPADPASAPMPSWNGGTAPLPRPPQRKARLWLHVTLFVLTVGSTWLVGGAAYSISLLVILIMGLATSVILTPVVTLEILIFLEILDVFLPIPNFVIEPLADVYQWAFTAVEAGTSQPLTFAAGLAAFLVPGTTVILLGWLWLRRFLFRSGVGGFVETVAERIECVGCHG